MKVNVTWKGKMHFQTNTPSGHTISMDAAPEAGGENKGARPTEMVLSAVGTCSAIDIVDILRKMRLNVEEFSMEIEGKRAENHPRRFTEIHLHYVLKGKLPKEKVRRAVQLSLDKYCSVSNSLNAQITSSFEINGKRFEMEQ